MRWTAPTSHLPTTAPSGQDDESLHSVEDRLYTTTLLPAATARTSNPVTIKGPRSSGIIFMASVSGQLSTSRWRAATWTSIYIIIISSARQVSGELMIG